MRYRSIILASLVLISWVGFLGLMGWWQDQQVVYPLGRHYLLESHVLGETTYQASNSAQAQIKDGIVYGFLPYWNVDDYQLDDSLTHVAYFRLALQANGSLANDVGLSMYQSERFTHIVEQIERQNLKFDLTIFTSHSDDIYAFVTCEQCQERLIAQLDDIITQDHVDGINLDLEYLGTLTQDEQQKMTYFLYHLKNMLQEKHPRTKLSIDVYGGAANMDSNLWDFSKIGQIVDRVIIMGYDYKTTGADTPGSSSPTLGANLWNGGIWENVLAMKRYVSSDKIILAIPFYGYAWETTTCELATAKTHPDTGQTLTYRGAQNILADNAYRAVEHWDENSLTPYIVFHDPEVEEGSADDRCHIGFFENERSLTYKINLIENLNLGGIAIWALGFEGDYPELWQTINSRF